MKLSAQWLKEWINVKLTTQELGDQLTMAGLEVSGITPVSASFSKVKIGKIREISPHPQADRLQICQVDVGDETPLQIVCGAKNVAPQKKVPVAVVGAQLSSDFKIKKAKLRGVFSEGMICSAKELGLEDDSQGILLLPDDAPLGRAFYDYYRLDDHTMDIELTPNRGDCLSILGVARELSAINQCEINLPKTPEIKPEIDETRGVQLVAKEGCPRYVGRIIRGIDPEARTPLWMSERLRRSGIRQIYLCVDITNYVMLELGQPMHAFDLTRIEGNLRVCRAQESTSIDLLNDTTITIQPNTLLIADDKKPLAIAGLMGGAASAVSETTRDIFLESAYFSPEALVGQSRKYGIYTDSSYRFERGVDPNLQRRAIERATQLLIEIAGGRAGPLVDIVNEDTLPAIRHIHFRPERVVRILGYPVDEKEIARYLEGLGIRILSQSQEWDCQIPSYRFDLNTEIDLIEEIARLVGYNHLPEQKPTATLHMSATDPTQLLTRQLKTALSQSGYHEAITYSFVDSNVQADFIQESQALALKLANPISNDMSDMRLSLWPGLFSTFLFNLRRQEKRMRLFESGLCFTNSKEGIQQIPRMAGLVSGDVFPEQWGLPSQPVDFYDVKAHLEHIFSAIGLKETVEFIAGDHHALHPGQTARLILRDVPVGWLGLLHPNLQQKHGLTEPVILWELALDPLLGHHCIQFQPVPKYPGIRRDLSFIVKKSLVARDICHAIESNAGEHLKKTHVFDVYHGKGMADDEKSLALALVFQHTERTLLDEDINPIIEQVISVLKQQYHAKLRDVT